MPTLKGLRGLLRDMTGVQINGRWRLSLCLTGEALTVVGRMTTADILSYDKVKLALLERFRYTPEDYLEKFKDLKPVGNETGNQFCARLSSYFGRWVETWKTDKTFEAPRDKIFSVQFLKNFHTKLYIFLKERYCNRLDGIASPTEQ